MAMTKKHYVALAEMLGRVRREANPKERLTVDKITNELTAILKADNERFDVETFHAAVVRNQFGIGE